MVKVNNVQTDNPELHITPHLPVLLLFRYLLYGWLCVKHFYRSEVTCHSAFCVFSKVFEAFFLHSWLWLGCHSFIRVRSLSVAPSCLPPPPLVLLNESCGSLVVARSRASSCTLYWQAYNSLRLISACSVSQQLDRTPSGPISGRTKKSLCYILICL